MASPGRTSGEKPRPETGRTGKHAEIGPTSGGTVQKSLGGDGSGKKGAKAPDINPVNPVDAKRKLRRAG